MSGELGMGVVALKGSNFARPPVDSVRPAPPVAVADVPVADGAAIGAAPEVADAPPGALARLGQMLPGVDAVVRAAYVTAAVSLVAVAAILYVVWDAFSARMIVADLVVIGVILSLPALAVALAGWTLADVAALPGQLRQAALQAAGRDGGPPRKGSRIVRVVKSLWAARGLALLTKGGWLKAVGALRFVRLASLPFALALVAFVALNGVIIVAGAIALLTLIL